MSEKIKLIWDFRGMEAKPIAEHHRIHLEEFAEKEGFSNCPTGIQVISEMFCTAYIVVNKPDMITFRDALKPHRGEIAE